MEGMSYYQYIYSELISFLDYKGRATRTEYAYFVLFGISCCIIFCTLSYYVMFIFSHGYTLDYYRNLDNYIINPVVIIILQCLYFLFYACYSLFCLWLLLAKISITFRRSRDIGFTILGVIQFVPLLNIILVPFLIFKKGKDVFEDEESLHNDKQRLLKTTIPICGSILFIIITLYLHLNYDYTVWWVDEWFIIFSAIITFVIIALVYYLLIVKRIINDVKTKEI